MGLGFYGACWGLDGGPQILCSICENAVLHVVVAEIWSCPCQFYYISILHVTELYFLLLCRQGPMTPIDLVLKAIEAFEVSEVS